MTADEMPPDLRRLLDEIPIPALPPVDVAAILAREAERQANAARFWKRTAAFAVGLAAAALIALGWPAPTPTGDYEALRDRLAKLEATPQPIPDHSKLEAKLADINDLLLTLATDVNERDEKQRLALRTLAKQLTELRSLSDRRWTEAKSTTDALYTLNQTSRKEQNR